MGRLEDIVFDNRILHDLPVDEGEAHTPRPVRGAVCARVRPTPIATPQLVAASPEAIELLGLEPAEVIIFLTRSCPSPGDGRMMGAAHVTAAESFAMMFSSTYGA
jgi:hypothetical protein